MKKYLLVFCLLLVSNSVNAEIRTLRDNTKTKITIYEANKLEVQTSTTTLQTNIDTKLSASSGPYITTNTENIAQIRLDTATLVGVDNEIKTSTGTLVKKTGDTMTGGLTINNQGTSFTVNTATFVIKEGNVGIGTVNPLSNLQIRSGSFKEIQIGAIAGTFANETYFTDLISTGIIINFSAPSDGGFKHSIFSYGSIDKDNLGIVARSHIKFVVGAVANNGMILYDTGSLWISSNCSADSFTDRTPYPKDKQEAYDSVLSMQKNIATGGVDHEKLTPFLKVRTERKKEIFNTITKSTDTVTEVEFGRNLSGTVSALTEVIKDLIKRIEILENKK